MEKLYGQEALQLARHTGAQLYYEYKAGGRPMTRPVTVAEVVQELLDQDPGGVTCDAAAPPRRIVRREAA